MFIFQWKTNPSNIVAFQIEDVGCRRNVPQSNEFKVRELGMSLWQYSQAEQNA
jgi:hypothetical protein